MVSVRIVRHWSRMLNTNPSPVNGRAPVDRPRRGAARRGRRRAGARDGRAGARGPLRAQPQHGVAHPRHARAPRAGRARPGLQPLPARLRRAARSRPPPGTSRSCGSRTRPASAGGGDAARRPTSPSPRRLELVYADQVQARHVMAPDWMGHAVPLHATSTGKAFLAALPPEELDAAPARAARALHRDDDHDAGRPARRARPRSARAAGRSRAASSSPRSGASRRRSATAPGRPAAVLSVWGADARVRDRVDALGDRAADAARALEALLA